MDNINFSLTEVFQEILDRRQTQGSMSQDEFTELVDEVLEEKREAGEIEDDFDFQQAREALIARWEEVAEADDKEARGIDADEELS